MLESYGWKLLDVERANPVPEAGEFSEEVEDMLERTRNNPNAIIYGTFYSYPVMLNLLLCCPNLSGYPTYQDLGLSRAHGVNPMKNNLTICEQG